MKSWNGRGVKSKKIAAKEIGGLIQGIQKKSQKAGQALQKD